MVDENRAFIEMYSENTPRSCKEGGTIWGKPI